MQTNKLKSGIIYKGSSNITGDNIVVIGVFNTKTPNSKTGPVLQTYILTDNGFDPSYNNKHGMDDAICGRCIHRGTPNINSTKKLAEGRSCYVQMQGVKAVWRTYNAGRYKQVSPADLGRGRFVRLGSYGDPLAAPSHVWANLLSESIGHTAYTHQSGLTTPTEYPMLTRMMLSADSKEEAKQAHRAGTRTFRVIPVKDWKEQGLANLLDSEIICPSSKGVTCLECQLCKGGATGKSIAIPAHGIGAGNFKG